MDLPVFGLKNDNSVCYLNSLLQCLFSSPDLTQYILNEDVEEHRTNNKNHIAVYFTLINTIVNHPSFKEDPDRLMKVDPRAFKEIFIRSSDRFTLGMQEDADEFLVTALDALHEDLKTRINPQKDLSNIDPQVDQNLYQYILSYKDNYSFVSRLFHTQVCTKTSCSGCGHGNKKYDNSFQIYLTPANNDCHLYDCLEQFRTPELLEDYRCDECTRKNTTTRVSTPSVLPMYVTFVMKRFGNQQLANIESPLTNLDLTTFINEEDRNSFLKLDAEKYKHFKYELYGAVFHVGSTLGGHYYAICKRRSGWYLFNDEQVKLLNNVSENYFKRAYMLFYRRLK